MPVLALHRNRQGQWLALLPVAIIFAASLMLVHFLLPAAHDGLTESYEPTKTLRFFYSHGQQLHKWGPMPGFVYAPEYAVLLAIDKGTGHLAHVTSQYPFGLDDPERELGAMIFAARIVTLLIGLAGIYYLTRTLQRQMDNPVAPVLAVLLCLSTSLVFLEPLADTKPDGLMAAFLLFALANYAAIVLRGFTRARAVGLAFFYVASFSCKELTTVTFALPYLALIVVSLLRMRRHPAEGKRDFRLLILSCFSGVVFYLLLNVIYAPHAWRERMAMVFGPLKDPAIWAGVHQTHASYLIESLRAIEGSLGWGGVLLLVLTIAGGIAFPSWRLLLLWLPFLSHAGFTIATAGYMPAYFMLPLGPALCLPSSYVLSQWMNSWMTLGMTPQTTSPTNGHGMRRAVILTAAIALVCTWVAFCATGLFRYTHEQSMDQTAFAEKLPSASTVNVVHLMTGNIVSPTPGPHGLTIDHRPLFAIIDATPDKRPEYLLVASDLQAWAGEIRALPSRAKMLKSQVGFDYSIFTGFEPLGYELESTLRPKLPRWCKPFVVADSDGYMQNVLLIYHLRRPEKRQGNAIQQISSEAR